MNDGSPLRGVIVSHAAVAQALVSAVAVITGIEGALTPVSNEGCGTDALAERLHKAVGSGPAGLFLGLARGGPKNNPRPPPAPLCGPPARAPPPPSPL